MNAALANTVRMLTAKLVFQKRLPARFGGGGLYLTPRADMRVLYPGYHRSAEDLMLVAERYVKKGDCVWDVGSNQGIFAACAAYKAGSQGEVLSLEADPSYAALQTRSFVRLGEAYAPISVLCAAAYSKFEVLDLMISSKGHARNSLDLGVPQDGVELSKPVVTLPLDSLLARWPNPNVVKIDVEGAEIDVLRGATKLLTAIRPIIYLEVWEHNSQEAGRIFKEVDYECMQLSQDAEAVVSGCGPYTVAIPKAR